MTIPATLGIFSDDHDGAFVAQWASPERTIPALAHWIENCRTTKVIPTATTYREFAATDDGDHFRTDYPPDATEPDNVQYRYVIRAGAYGNGWVANLTVFRAHARPDREPLLTVWHEISFTNTDTRPLHLLAFRGLVHIIKFVRSLDRPQHTRPALQAWTERATWHRDRAGIA